MDQQSPPTISLFSAEETASHLRELGALLHACVQAGASIGFVLPFAAEESEAFWREKVLPEVRAGTRALLVARLGGGIAGVVQLGTCMPPWFIERRGIGVVGPSLPVEPGIHRHSRDLGRGIER